MAKSWDMLTERDDDPAVVVFFNVGQGSGQSQPVNGC
jgi:hypothetical protein